jgi:superfamily II DNA or RNA helicase
MHKENAHGRIKYIKSMLDIDKALGNVLSYHDRCLAQIEMSRYTNHETIREYKFQNEAVKQACSKKVGKWHGESGTGSGKTIIAAKIARHFMRRGLVIYVCHNVTSIGGELTGGVMTEFSNVLRRYEKREPFFGRLNEPSDAYDVIFLTPRFLVVDLWQKNRKLYEKLRRKCSLLIIDEAHHYADEARAQQVIYGKVDTIANEFAKTSRVVTLTATHGRMDGTSPLGCTYDNVDWRFTLQNGIEHGINPELYGIQVFLDLGKIQTTQSRGEFINLKFSNQQYRRYLNLVAGVMVKVYKRYPVATCAFTRTVSDAHALCKAFNKASGLGPKGLVVLSHKTSLNKRLQYVADIQEGKRLGYITCGVGEESLNIKRIEIIHLVRRSKSINRNIQSTGRGMRQSIETGKKRCLVIDYNVVEHSIINASIGLADFARVKNINSKLKKFKNGGPLVTCKKNYRNFKCVALANGSCISEERAWVLKNTKSKSSRSSLEEKEYWLNEMEKCGLPTPRRCHDEEWMKYHAE